MSLATILVCWSVFSLALAPLVGRAIRFGGSRSIQPAMPKSIPSTDLSGRAAAHMA